MDGMGGLRTLYPETAQEGAPGFSVQLTAGLTGLPRNDPRGALRIHYRDPAEGLCKMLLSLLEALVLDMLLRLQGPAVTSSDQQPARDTWRKGLSRVRLTRQTFLRHGRQARTCPQSPGTQARGDETPLVLLASLQGHVSQKRW